MQRDARIESDSIFASAVLSFTNQFSEFYHNVMDAMQGFVSLCEPSLTFHSITTKWLFNGYSMAYLQSLHSL